MSTYTNIHEADAIDIVEKCASDDKDTKWLDIRIRCGDLGYEAKDRHHTFCYLTVFYNEQVGLSEKHVIAAMKKYLQKKGLDVVPFPEHVPAMNEAQDITAACDKALANEKGNN